MESTAIDFRKLYLQEKAKRLKKKGTSAKQQQDHKEEEEQPAKSRNEVEEKRKPGQLPPWIHGDFSDALPRVGTSLTKSVSTPTSAAVAMACCEANDWFVCTDPPRLYYWRHYLPASICRKLVTWLDQLEVNHHHHHDRDCSISSLNRWTVLPHAKRNVAVLQAPFVVGTPIDIIVRSISHLFDPRTPPNHVLINDYRQATTGIMAHTDGPAYASCTANISIGLLHDGSDQIDEGANCGVIFTFTPRSSSEISSQPPSCSQGMINPCSIVLHGTGSLVVFQDDLYSNYLHAIDNLEIEASGGGGRGVGGSHFQTPGPDEDSDDEGVVQEVTNDTCCNVPSGTLILRSARRISLTIRHKYSSSSGHDGDDE